jgi:hypothetical protein
MDTAKNAGAASVSGGVSNLWAYLSGILLVLLLIALFLRKNPSTPDPEAL